MLVASECLAFLVLDSLCCVFHLYSFSFPYSTFNFENSFYLVLRNPQSQAFGIKLERPLKNSSKGKSSDYANMNLQESDTEELSKSKSKANEEKKTSYFESVNCIEVSINNQENEENESTSTSLNNALYVYLRNSHNEYFDEIKELAKDVISEFENYDYTVNIDETKRNQVPQLTIYKKASWDDKNNEVPILSVDFYLKIYCNNFEYNIVRRFFAPEKETFNNLELFNLGFASEEDLEQLCKLIRKNFESNPKRLRNIILYGGVRKSKGKIKLMNEEKIKKILSIISKFKTGSILFIDFELSWDIFVQIIQMMKWRFVILFLNWLIVSKNIIESYAKINNKSSRLIKFCNCNFESNYLDDSEISDEKSTELSYVIKYICLNKYWEKHLHKIFLYFLFFNYYIELVWYLLIWNNICSTWDNINILETIFTFFERSYTYLQYVYK